MIQQALPAGLQQRLENESLAMSSQFSPEQITRVHDQLDLVAREEFEASEMAVWEQGIWVVLFFSMVLVATTGNMIVIYIVSTNKDMKSVTNYFLVNLSLADTMVSMLNVVFNLITMLKGLVISILLNDSAQCNATYH